MKLAIASDLHLDFKDLPDAFFQEKADVLLLAGDTCESRYLKKFEKTFKKICNHYKEVFLICGNHEFYHNFYPDTLEEMDKFATKFDNLFFLNNDVVHLHGYRLIASTLWTDCNKRNPLTVDVVKDGVKDYKLIKVLDSHYRKLHPRDTIRLNDTSVKFIT
jgi:predicted phosphodiesterase